MTGRRRLLAVLLLAGALLAPATARCVMVSVQSPLIKILGSTGSVTTIGQPVSNVVLPGDNVDAGFWGSMQTADGRNLLYIRDQYLGTSRFVFDIDGSIHDLEFSDLISQPVTTAGSGLGATISYAKSIVPTLNYGATWTIVNNPRTNNPADTVMIQGWISNSGPLPHHVGLRLLLDVEIIDSNYDGAPLSIDNGLSAINQNTLFEAATAPIPSDWWTYDNISSPSLVARGVTWGNQFGPPATQPDAVEFCQWSDVATPYYYSPDPDPGAAFSSYVPPNPSDTCVVLWYTNTKQASYLDPGTLAPNGDNYVVNPGQTLVFTTYYGLNQGVLGQTPTPYASFTPTPSATNSPSITPTFSISPTFSVSPTTSPSFTITRTHTISPTYSVSPTITQSFTTTPSFTVSPSSTPTATATPSFSSSPSFSITPTYTITPTFSATPTATATPSITPTFSISPTYSPSPSHSPSPSVTATQVPNLTIVGKPPNPNPAGPGGPMYLPYVLSRDATVTIRIFDIAGEKVYDLPPFAGRQGANEEQWPLINNAGAGVASGVFIGHYVASVDGQSADCWEKMAVVR